MNNPMGTNEAGDNAYVFDFSDQTILIAEDIDFSYLYIEAVLRRTGAKVLWAQNGKEAVDFVKSNPKIDLVLMDMYMPVMDGYDATRLITELRPELPVIAQTAFVLPADVKRCFTAGCSGFLAKPIRKEQLLNTLDEFINKLKQQNSGLQIGKVSNG
jgi:CheY-like chemotaxis protein